MKTKNNGSTRGDARPYFELIVVREVKPLDGFRAHFVFTDGSEREIDLDQYLHGPVFEPIRNDPELFRNMFVDGGTINWPGEVDIAPDTLYYGDEDPPWVKYDKERELKAQQKKRIARKTTPAPRPAAKAKARKKPIAKSRPRKMVLAKKK